MYDCVNAKVDHMIRSDFAIEGLEVKAAEDSIGVFSGIASTSDIDRGGDVIKAGAFGDVKIKNIPMLWAHDMRAVIGGWKSIDTSGNQIKVEGELNLDVPLGAQTYALLSKGHVNGLSVGFMIKPGGAAYDEKTGIRKITAGELIEISVVPVPANTKARIKRVKSADGLFAASEEFKSILADDYGFSEEDIDIILTKGYHALVEKRDPPALPAPVADEVRGLLTALKGRR